MSFSEKHEILYLNQYGFRKKHSTILALITLTDKIKQVIDNGEYAIGIYLDLKKSIWYGKSWHIIEKTRALRYPRTTQYTNI